VKKTLFKKTIIILLALVFIILSAGALYLSLYPIDISEYRDEIASVMEERTGNRVVGESFALRVLPSPYISIGRVEVFEKEEMILRIRAIRLKVSLLPLFYRKVVVDDMVLEGAELYLGRDAEGRLNIADTIERIKGRERRPRIESLRVKGGSIRFTDKSLAEPQEFVLKDVKGGFTRTGAEFDFKASAVLEPGTKVSFKGGGGKVPDGIRLSATLDLKRLTLQRLNPYLKTRSPEALLGGTVDVDLGYGYDGAHEIKGTVAYRDLTVDYPPVLTEAVISESGSFRARLYRDEGSLDISLDDLDLAMEGFGVKGAFALTGPVKDVDGRRLTLDVKTTEIPVERFTALIPHRILSGKVAQAVADVKPVGGRLAIKSLKVASTIREIRDGSVIRKPGGLDLRVALQKLSFRHRGVKEAFSGFSGTVTLKDDTLGFEALSGNYVNGVVEKFSGKFHNMSTSPGYEIALKAFMDTGETLEIVRALYKPRNGVMGKLAGLNITGPAHVDVSAKGEFREGLPASYSGVIKPSRVSLDYPGLPVSLRSVEGEFSFDTERVDVEKLEGLDSTGSALSVKGAINDYRGENPAFNLMVDGELTADTLFKVTGKAPTGDLSLEGRLSFGAEVRGRLESLTAQVFVNLTPAGLEYGKTVKKDVDVPMSIRGNIEFDGDEASLNKTVVTFGKSTAGVNGSFKRDFSAYGFLVKSESIHLSDLDDLSPLFAKEFSSEGIVKLNLDVRKSEKDDAATYEGDMTLEGGRLSSPLIAKPLEDMDIEARFDKNSFSLKVRNLSAGQTKIKGVAQIPDLSERHLILDIESSEFYLDDFREKDGRSFRDWITDIIEVVSPGSTGETPDGKKRPPLTGDGSVTIKEGRAFGHGFTDLSTKLRIEEEAVYLHSLSFVTSEGPTEGLVIFYRDPDYPLIEMEMRFAGIKLKSFFEGFGLKKEVLSGTLYGSLVLSFERGAEPAAAGMNGSFFLRAEKGKMWKFLFFSKIFSIVNILSIDELFKEGLPYRFIDGDFKVKDGVISTSKLVFDSDSMRMSAVGEIDTANRTMEATLAMHPFVTIDKIITNIPLAGWILGGEEKSAISMYYELSGPLARPIVEPVPIKGIQEGIFSKLQRLIETPFGVMNKKNNNK